MMSLIIETLDFIQRFYSRPFYSVLRFIICIYDFILNWFTEVLIGDSSDVTSLVARLEKEEQLIRDAFVHQGAP